MNITKYFYHIDIIYIYTLKPLGSSLDVTQMWTKKSCEDAPNKGCVDVFFMYAQKGQFREEEEEEEIIMFYLLPFFFFPSFPLNYNNVWLEKYFIYI